MNKIAAEFLKRRRFEISEERGRKYDPLSIREMAMLCNMNEFTLGRLEKGIGKASHDNLRKMEPIYGIEVYDIYGEPRPMPDDIDPNFLFLWENRDDPNVSAILEQALSKAKAIKENKERPKQIVRNVSVTS
jgi:hypothetical protein